MKRKLRTIICLFCISTCAAVEEVGPRIVQFPKDRAVGRLKLRDTSSDDDSDRGLLSLPGWVLLGQAQGDVSVPAGKDLTFEAYSDVTDFSFLADLKPNDLQVLILSHEGISDGELVHLKGLTGLLGLDLGSTLIKGPGLVHLARLTSLRNLSLFNTQVSDTALEHLSTLTSLMNLSLLKTQIEGPGLAHLKSLTSLVSLDLGSTPITDDSLVHLAEMTWLKELELYDTHISNDGLAHLKPLRSLEELILGYARLRPEYSPITDKGLVYLKELDSLKLLCLLGTRVTDAGLAHLRNLKKLEALQLRETQITGEGLAFLKEVPALKYLDFEKTNIGHTGLANCKEWSETLESLQLKDTKISDADLAHLADFKALKSLNISNTSITDAGLVHLNKLNSLESLNVSNTSITDAGLVYLSKLKSLERLRVDNTEITDDGLMLLKNLPNLRNIHVMRTGVTNAGLEKFKQISASKSVKANIRMRIVSTKERGMEIVKSESSQIMGKPPSLLGRPLPNLKSIELKFIPEDTKEKAISICFFDMNQRPSRNCIMRLAKQAEQLKRKGVTVVIVQASKIDENTLNEWVKNYNIPFPVGMAQGDEEKTRFTWGIRSLPWLILTDKQHIVTAEGFTLDELNEKLGNNPKHKSGPTQ